MTKPHITNLVDTVTTRNFAPKPLQRIIPKPDEIICCDVCGERIGHNERNAYSWRTSRAICGLCLDDLLNDVAKCFPIGNTP